MIVVVDGSWGPRSCKKLSTRGVLAAAFLYSKKIAVAKGRKKKARKLH